MPVARAALLSSILLIAACSRTSSAPDAAAHASASDAQRDTSATCRGPGRYEAGKEGSYLPCCAGLTEVFYKKAGHGEGNAPVCADVPLRVYACVSGFCGDGVCEAGEAPACGCVADCPSAAWERPDAAVDVAPARDVAVRDHDARTAENLRGYWVSGNELRALQPCGSSELIWVNVEGNEPGLNLLSEAQSGACRADAGQASSCHPIYIEMSVLLWPPGRHGHLGQYDRALDIVRITRASATAPSDCTRPEPRFPGGN